MADIKDHIIKCIYRDNDSIERFRYKIVFEENVSYLKKNYPYFGFNFYGFNNFLVFFELKGEYYSFFVDRKTLSYEKKFVKKDKVIIEQIKLEVSDNKLYRYTIFDGIYN